MGLFQRSSKPKGGGLRPEDPARSLATVVGEAELGTFPSLVSEALRRIAEPEFDLTEIADLLVNDPGVTVRLLGLVNSAALSRGRPVTSVHQAVVIVGRNQLESLLISLAVKGALPDPAVPGFDRGRLWATATRRAAIAGQLAAIVDPSRRSENFTAALLQDMALPVLADRTTGYSNTLLDWHASPIDLAVLEREAYGWDHGEIASLMAANWQFPTDLVEFLDGHHQATSDSDHLLPARVVAPVRESDRSGDEELIDLATDAFSLPADRVLEVVESVAAESERLASLLR